MLKPKLLGSLILFYLVLYKLWEFFVVFMGARPSGRIEPESYLVMLGYALIAVFGLVLFSYLVGSIGLFLRRRWSAVVVFYSAIVEATILLLACTVFLYASIDGSLGNVPPLGILPLLLLLVFPAGFGYAARNLRNNPELWETSEKISTDVVEPSGRIQVKLISLAKLKNVFWIIVGTGLLIPVILALIVVTASLMQEEAFDLSGDDLFVFVLGTVLFSLPYIVLAFIARAVLKGALKKGGDRPVQSSFVLAGIFIGMTKFIVPNLYFYFSNAEAVSVLIFAPFIPFMAALPGIILGAIVGFIAYTVWRYFRR